MKCPTCEKLGLRSKVYVGGSSMTLAMGVTWYDEDGNLHTHDPNVYTTTYSCSHGHVFAVRTRQGSDPVVMAR